MNGLRPSSMHRTVKCPAWLLTEGEVPKSETSQADADEGTAAHEVLNWTLSGPQQFRPGDKTKVGVFVTQEMLDHADSFLSYCSPFVNGLPKVKFYTELPLDCSLIYPGLSGTADVIIDNRVNKTLTVIDYKYGRVPVPVEDNWQLISYCLGYWDKLGRPDDYKFNLVVYQPRSYHGDDPAKLVSFGVPTLSNYLSLLMQACRTATTPGNMEYRLGGHCLNCPRRHVCSTLSRAVGNVHEWLTEPTPIGCLSPKGQSSELSLLCSAELLLKAKKTGLELVIMDAIKSGKTGYLHTLRQTAGRLNWTIAVDEIEQLGEIFGVKLTHPEPITPTQAMKLKIPQSAVEALSERKPGSWKLEEINEFKLKKMFGGGV